METEDTTLKLRHSLALAALALIALPLPGHAAPRTMEAVFLDEDDRPVETIAVQEMQISITGGQDGMGGDSHNQVSVSLDPETFRNARVLAWMARCDEKTGLLLRSMTGDTSDSFLLNGIGSCSFNISQSSTFGPSGQSMLSITSRRLTVNGNTLN